MRISDWSSDVCSSDLAEPRKTTNPSYDQLFKIGPPHRPVSSTAWEPASASSWSATLSHAPNPLARGPGGCRSSPMGPDRRGGSKALDRFLSASPILPVHWSCPAGQCCRYYSEEGR